MIVVDHRHCWADPTVKRSDLFPVLIITHLFVRNLLSSDVVTKLFDKAVAACLANERVTNILGRPIYAPGETFVKIND